jgi:hypothetical protein
MSNLSDEEKAFRLQERPTACVSIKFDEKDAMMLTGRELVLFEDLVLQYGQISI